MKGPGTESKRGNVPEGADDEKGAAANPVNQVKSDKGEKEIGKRDQR